MARDIGFQENKIYIHKLMKIVFKIINKNNFNKIFKNNNKINNIKNYDFFHKCFKINIYIFAKFFISIFKIIHSILKVWLFNINILFSAKKA